MISDLSKHVEIRLHPLQRDQNLEKMISEQEANSIMMDFSIEPSRQLEILKEMEVHDQSSLL